MIKNKTKIITTLGPSSNNEETIKQLINAGTNMFRLNSSHGNKNEHTQTISLIRKIEKEIKTFIPIMIDLQGPKIRVGELIEPVILEKNKELVLEYGIKQTEKSIIPVDYKGLTNDVKEGNIILLDDGKIRLRVTKNDGNRIIARILNGEILQSRKGINIPDETESISTITEKDADFIKFSVENDADYLALSFVRNRNDILLAKKYLNHFGSNIQIVAKIEKPEAVKNIDSILEVTDAVMIARGDLGIELNPEKVPMVQKQIVKQATIHRKTCIVATQMLESMIESPIPTRAETSDVANAIIDGADAVMLSGETAVGKFPVESVKMISKIAKDVEDGNFLTYNLDLEVNSNYQPTPQAIASAATKMAKDLNAKAILAFTHTGYTVKLLSKLRPSVPVFAISDREDSCRKLNLNWDIIPIQKDWDVVLDDTLLKKIDKLLLKTTDFQKDERVIIIGSIPQLITGHTNFVRIHRICAFD